MDLNNPLGGHSQMEVTNPPIVDPMLGSEVSVGFGLKGRMGSGRADSVAIDNRLDSNLEIISEQVIHLNKERRDSLWIEHPLEIVSKLSPAQLDEIIVNYGIPEDWSSRLAYPSEVISSYDEGFFSLRLGSRAWRALVSHLAFVLRAMPQVWLLAISDSA